MDREHLDNAKNPIHDHNHFTFPKEDSKGDDTQKLSVIQSIPELLKTNHNETVSRILPKIQHDLPTASYEFQIATTRLFRYLMEHHLPVDILHSVLIGIESKDPIIANAWIDTLLDYIPKLTKDTLIKQIIPLAKAKSQLANNVSYRIASCQMLGLICVNPNIPPLEVKKDILPLVTSLCQDVSIEVRSAICEQLPQVAKGLGSENIVKSSLLPCLVELCSDDNLMVRASAVDSVVHIVPFLNKDAIKVTIIPLVKQLCMRSVQPADTTFTTLAKDYGKLLNGLENHFTKDDCLWFLKFYVTLSSIGKPTVLDNVESTDPVLSLTCRELCAQNLPAITQFTVTYLKDHIDIWLKIFQNLSQDSCYMVRKTVACCLHEIIRTLELNNQIVKNEIILLLLDDAEEVLECIIPNIGAIMESLSSSDLLSSETLLPTGLELGRALLKCQQQILQKNNWRIKVVFLKELEHLPNCFPSSYIHQYFTPVIFNIILKERAKPVRTQSARTMLIFLRYNLQETHRKWIRDNLIQLSVAKSCYTRRVYIDMIKEAIDIFSRKYVKEYFVSPLLALTEDPVSIIRYAVVKMMPQLMNIMELPLDQKFISQIESVLRSLQAIEKDRDVLEKLNEVLQDATNTSKLSLVKLSHFEEKQRIEEEEHINRGKNITINRNLLKDATKVQYKVEKGVQQPVAQSSEMSFLEQHFYIDAGISLPEAINKNVTNVINMLDKVTIKSATDVEQIESITTNITDDMKVNIQKLRRFKPEEATVEVNRRLKRYSSTFSVNYDKETRENGSNMRKRRSLNISTSDLSKIPVSFKSYNKINVNKSDDGICQFNKTNQNSIETKENVPIKITKASNLPVFIKRPTARK